MKNVYETFETEKSTEIDGIEIDYGAFKFTLARAGGANKKFSRILETLTKPYRRAIETETMDPERTRQLLAEAYSKAVILGWSGVKDRDGKAIKFSPENCLKLLVDLPDLFVDLQLQANQSALFLKEAQEADAGN